MVVVFLEKEIILSQVTYWLYINHVGVDTAWTIDDLRIDVHLTGCERELAQFIDFFFIREYYIDQQ